MVIVVQKDRDPSSTQPGETNNSNVTRSSCTGGGVENTAAHVDISSHSSYSSLLAWQ